MIMYNSNQICGFELAFNLVTEEDVFDSLMPIKNTATENDDINIHFSQLCIPFILPFLVHIMNCILLEGKYPNCHYPNSK